MPAERRGGERWRRHPVFGSSRSSCLWRAVPAFWSPGPLGRRPPGNSSRSTSAFSPTVATMRLSPPRNACWRCCRVSRVTVIPMRPELTTTWACPSSRWDNSRMPGPTWSGRFRSTSLPTGRCTRFPPSCSTTSAGCSWNWATSKRQRSTRNKPSPSVSRYGGHTT